MTETAFLIGENCQFSDCNKLDFLPIKCSACDKHFCSNHYKFIHHNCEKATPEQLKPENNYQIPVCPKCDRAVPFIDGKRDPNEAINKHLEVGDCGKQTVKSSSNKTKDAPQKNLKGKIYKNRCNKLGCKKKMAVPMKCVDCQKVFCLAHRFEKDHECEGKIDVQREARLRRFDPSYFSTTKRAVEVK